jgi:tRNA A37 threonylcarbamoyladenosine synthetase subunit TsaC/SUA5/YrdC
VLKIGAKIGMLCEVHLSQCDKSIVSLSAQLSKLRVVVDRNPNFKYVCDSACVVGGETPRSANQPSIIAEVTADNGKVPCNKLFICLVSLPTGNY